VEVNVLSVAFLRGEKVIVNVFSLAWLSVKHLIAKSTRIFTLDNVGDQEADISILHWLRVIMLV
jgi:uncharacterized protein YifE (UPF0438 family)